MRQTVRPSKRIEGTITPPGDKSISLRALLLNSISTGTAHIANLCVGDDRRSILRCLRGLGVPIRLHSACPITQAEECFEVRGQGLDGLSEPTSVLNAGNSGTTMRLVSGVLAAQPFFSVISGDRSLRSRPMDRIVKPLTLMGAQIIGRDEGSMAPLAFRGGTLKGINYSQPVASAQVKSSLLIAGLYAEGQTIIDQPADSRDHTERMLSAMGAAIELNGPRVAVQPSALKPMDMTVPGDISSAAFWLVAASAHPNARVRIESVGINPSRNGVLDVLRAMGARIRVENVREEANEPVADLVAESSDLVATEVRGDVIPRVIDELPVLALAACFAKGTTVIGDAAELRVKESDRIRATVEGLSSLGAAGIEERPDGMVIQGGQRLTGGTSESYGDHRIAMTMGVAGMLANGETVVDGAQAASVSYPGFWDALQSFGESDREVP